MVVRRRPTLPHSLPCSTIGAEGLSFRVRNGTGRFPLAMTAVTLWRCPGHEPAVKNWFVGARLSGTAQWTRTRKCLGCGEVIGLLVPVSFTGRWSPLPHPAYLPSGLAGSLSDQGPWKPHLEAGFPLRCFQRLSLPNVANQPCSWRNNWHTRGSSVPVLSY